MLYIHLPWGLFILEKENLHSHKMLNLIIDRSYIHNHQNLKKNQIPFKEQMDKQIVLVSNEKK